MDETDCVTAFSCGRHLVIMGQWSAARRAFGIEKFFFFK